MIRRYHLIFWCSILLTALIAFGYGQEHSEAADDDFTVLLASKDTPKCASRAEYDALREYMSLSTVRALFDIQGRDEGDNPSGTNFRVSFPGCDWTDGQRVWTSYGYDGTGLRRWWLR